MDSRKEMWYVLSGASRLSEAEEQTKKYRWYLGARFSRSMYRLSPKVTSRSSKIQELEEHEEEEGEEGEEVEDGREDESAKQGVGPSWDDDCLVHGVDVMVDDTYEDSDENEDIHWKRVKANSICVLEEEEEDQIDRDLARVRPETLEWLFGSYIASTFKPNILNAAKRILMAFSARNRKSIGYVQGHQNICLLVLSEFFVPGSERQTRQHEEERAFWVFCALCEVVLGQSFFSRAPRLEGFQQAVSTINQSIGRQKFDMVGTVVDKQGVVELLCFKWLLQLWSDEEVIQDVNLVKRIYDCLFLSAAGCGLYWTAEEALKSTLASGKTPTKTDFHLRLIVAIIKDTPILARSGSESSQEDLEPLVSGIGIRRDVESVARLRSATYAPHETTLSSSPPTASLPLDSLSPSQPSSTTRSTQHHVSSRQTHSPSIPTEGSIPPLRRKASLEEMGVHATGHVFDSILHRVRQMSSRKLEELILLAEHTVLADKKSPSKVVSEERQAAEKRDAESRSTIAYVQRLYVSSESLLIGYATFKQLAQQACPSWSSRDVMEVFSTLDVARNGQVDSSFLLQQLPNRFPERSLQDLENLATTVYTYCVKQISEGKAYSNKNPRSNKGVDEACSPTPSQCALQ